MSQTLTSTGQSLVDICLQELGDVGAAFELADANGLAVTDQLTPGQVLLVPATVLARPEVARYFAGRGQRINTGAVGLPAPEPVDGLHDFLDSDFTDPDFF